MTAENDSIDNYPDNQGLLSRDNIKAYLLTTFGIAIIIALYYILVGPAAAMQPPGGQPPGGQPSGPPGQSLTPIGGGGIGLQNSWPLWGQLVVPSLLGLGFGIAVFSIFALSVTYVYKKEGIRSSIYALVLVGVLLIIATSLIQGWETGITQTIGGSSEIFSDMINVNGFIDFISNYEALQPVLSLHAQTQPPGAVLFIYSLYLVLGSPDLIAIGLCIIAAIISSFFMRGIFRHLFDEEHARYATFLYLILPAIQVYYLANIYAIVATLVLGVLYFHLYSDRRIAAIGTFLCLFLLTFVTFLSAFMVFFLFIYEILKANSENETEGIVERLRVTVKSLQYPLILSLCVGVVYGLLLVTLGFNYVNAFLYASALENPNGFMLLASPVEYFVTRIQNILDIAIFFGPVLSVLAYRGFVILQKEATENSESSKKYNLILASLIALGLLFLTGAPKKGETARICMFILPFLLIPVLTYIQRTEMSRRDKAILLLVVFGQAVLLQIIGLWLW
ncbi:MAG: hypothetical protein ACFFEV_03030 [Candidatus Thorarchaeota archaeon]